MNFLYLTDSYKVTHWKQYPKGTSKVYSYFESRGGRYDKIAFFGLQYFLKKYLTGPVVMPYNVTEAKHLFKLHFGQDLFNEEGWRYIATKHGGRLPVEIRSVPEGTIVNTRQPLISIENTDNAVPWLTNYLESLLVQTWYPTTVCTQSRFMRQRILDTLEKSGDPAGIDFKLHDFGFRGVSSPESAAIGGLAHLANFKGTDTLIALDAARRYYNERCAGHSIPATEHSTITSWGREGELDAYRNVLEAYPEGLVACVSDSYDIYNAVENLWGKNLKENVVSRNGVLIVRPDSGEPCEVVPKLLLSLYRAFGGRKNDKGYLVLDDHVRLIQGDGIDVDSLGPILDSVLDAGFSTDNIAFGSGGGLLQKINRDTCKFAFKCSWAEVNGNGRDVYKEPVTDGGKRSKAGRFDSENLRTVFKNGELMVNDDLATIRLRLANDSTRITLLE